MIKMAHKSNWVYAAGVIPLLFFISSNTSAKEIHLQGTVTCKEKGDVGARPANSILVAPKQFINQSKLTDGQGLYNIGLPAADILDKTVTIHFRNEKGELGQLTESVWDAQIRRFKNQLVFFTQTSEVSEPCNTAENDPKKMQQQLALFTDEPNKARLLLDAGAAGGGVTVLASLPSFGGAAIAGPAGLGGTFTVAGISQSDAVAGQLSSVALSAKATNPGFSFSPTRNISDAAFWNAASLALSMRSAVNVVSDFDEFSRLSIAAPLGDRYGIGFGVIKLNQEDRRTATLSGGGASITQSFEYDELGVFISGGMLLNPQAEKPLALGVTLKYLKQDLEIAGIGDPVSATPGSDPVWDNSVVDDSKTDIDLSLSYQASPQLNIGLTLMSPLDEKLKDGNGEDRSQRATGLGASYKMGRTHLGAELIYRDEESETDMAIGVNVVPYNNTQVSAGYDSRYETTSLGLSYYWFTYTYNSSDIFDDEHMLGVNYRL